MEKLLQRAGWEMGGGGEETGVELEQICLMGS